MALRVHLPGTGRSFASGISVKVDTGESPDFSVFERLLPAGWTGPPRHLHHEYDEAFYVLDGSVDFHLDEGTCSCPAGSVVFVPRGAVHTFANPADAPARLLVITTAEALSLVEGLAALPGGPAAPDPVAAAALFARHRSDVLDGDSP